MQNLGGQAKSIMVFSEVAYYNHASTEFGGRERRKLILGASTVSDVLRVSLEFHPNSLFIRSTYRFPQHSKSQFSNVKHF